MNCNIDDLIQIPSGEWFRICGFAPGTYACKAVKFGGAAYVSRSIVIARVRADLSVREICNSASKRMAGRKKKHDTDWQKFREETHETFSRETARDVCPNGKNGCDLCNPGLT